MPHLDHIPDDRIILTVRDWSLVMHNMETMQKAIEKLEHEQLVFKAKLAVWMCICGGGSGLLMTIITAVILKHL